MPLYTCYSDFLQPSKKSPPTFFQKQNNSPTSMLQISASRACLWTLSPKSHRKNRRCHTIHCSCSTWAKSSNGKRRRWGLELVELVAQQRGGELFLVLGLKLLGCCQKLGFLQFVSSPHWKINMLNPKMEVWFKWFSFSIGWFLGSMLIFKGVTRGQMSLPILWCKVLWVAFPSEVNHEMRFNSHGPFILGY